MIISSSVCGRNPDITVDSTGTGPDGWRRWLRGESVRVGSDWPSLLAQHEEAFLKLCRARGASTIGASNVG
jgi:hypothetical protein